MIVDLLAAGHRYHDPRIGWFIADPNRACRDPECELNDHVWVISDDDLADQIKLLGARR